MANVVLVHGAFCDGSSWSGVIPLLQQAGHTVVAVQLPLSSLEDDVAVVKAAIAAQNGPTVVAAHSYGGAVLSGAATDATNVVGLVFVAAYALDEGETLGDINAKFADTVGVGFIRPSYRDGFVVIDPTAFPQYFAPDVDPAQAAVMAAVQKPQSVTAFGAKGGKPSWKQFRNWYLVSENDQIINPDAERWLAERMNATTIAVPSSHASPVSHSQEVADAIAAAASAS